MAVDVLAVCKVCADISKPVQYKGMCRPCYDADLRERRRNGQPAQRRRPKHAAVCKVCGDPDKEHKAQGMCRGCYNKHLYQKRKNNADTHAVPGVANHLAQPGSCSVAAQLGGAGSSESAAGRAAHGPFADGVVKRVVPVAHEVTALRWGPSWNDMLEAAEWLGSHGYMYGIKYASEQDRKRGVEIFPELHLMDERFRKHVVTHGLWVVAHPNKTFRIVDSRQLAHDYREAT